MEPPPARGCLGTGVSKNETHNGCEPGRVIERVRFRRQQHPRIRTGGLEYAPEKRVSGGAVEIRVQC